MKIYKVKVKFRQTCHKKFKGKKYSYFSFEELRVGDLVVVETVYGPSVAKVTEVVDANELLQLPAMLFPKWILHF